MSLHLFTVCRPWLFALPAASVLRLLLPDEARMEGLAPETAAAPAALGLLDTGAGRHPALDLGRLLGLPDQHAAFIVLAAAGSRPAFALRSGPCASVRALEESDLRRVPSGLQGVRPGVFRAAFPLSKGPRVAGHEGLAEAGLVVDLECLLTGDETRWVETLAAATGVAGGADGEAA